MESFLSKKKTHGVMMNKVSLAANLSVSPTIGLQKMNYIIQQKKLFCQNLYTYIYYN